MDKIPELKHGRSIHYAQTVGPIQGDSTFLTSAANTFGSFAKKHPTIDTYYNSLNTKVSDLENILTKQLQKHEYQYMEAF